MVGFLKRLNLQEKHGWTPYLKEIRGVFLDANIKGGTWWVSQISIL